MELAERLRASGARVTVAACDVADRTQIAALLDDLAGQGDPVRAVVHAAGAAQSVPLAEMTAEELSDVLRAKVDGAAHLDGLLPDGLDAFVVFSSIAGVWGSAGQAGYAAANAYLDGLVARRRAGGSPALPSPGGRGPVPAWRTASSRSSWPGVVCRRWLRSWR